MLYCVRPRSRCRACIDLLFCRSPPKCFSDGKRLRHKAKQLLNLSDIRGCNNLVSRMTHDSSSIFKNQQSMRAIEALRLSFRINCCRVYLPEDQRPWDGFVGWQGNGLPKWKRRIGIFLSCGFVEFKWSGAAGCLKIAERGPASERCPLIEMPGPRIDR